jgi:hypothetical protein
MGRHDPDADGPEDLPEPPRLRQLRYLVNTLMLVLIAGVVIVTALLAIRLAPLGAPPPPVPAELSLPAGESAAAVTLGRDWIAVVTEDEAGVERIRLLDRDTGLERAVVPIAPAE